MAVGGTEKYIVLYEIVNGNTVTRGEELGPHTETINSLCFFGESMLVCALKNGQVAIWNHYKSNMIKKIENVSPIRSIIQFQKKYICFTSEDGKVRIINMDEGKELRVFRYSEFPTAIDTNSDESLLYVGTNMGNIIKWNLNVVQPPRKRI
jgi:WD40 repeat protein